MKTETHLLEIQSSKEEDNNNHEDDDLWVVLIYILQIRWRDVTLIMPRNNSTLPSTILRIVMPMDLNLDYANVDTCPPVLKY